MIPHVTNKKRSLSLAHFGYLQIDPNRYFSLAYSEDQDEILHVDLHQCLHCLLG